MGAKRKPAGQGRDRLIAVRLSEEEHAAISEALQKVEQRTGLPVQLSAWVRRAIREQLKREGRT